MFTWSSDGLGVTESGPMAGPCKGVRTIQNGTQEGLIAVSNTSEDSASLVSAVFPASAMRCDELNWLASVQILYNEEGHRLDVVASGPMLTSEQGMDAFVSAWNGADNSTRLHHLPPDEGMDAVRQAPRSSDLLHVRAKWVAVPRGEPHARWLWWRCYLFASGRQSAWAHLPIGFIFASVVMVRLLVPAGSWTTYSPSRTRPYLCPHKVLVCAAFVNRGGRARVLMSSVTRPIRLAAFEFTAAF